MLSRPQLNCCVKTAAVSISLYRIYMRKWHYFLSGNKNIFPNRVKSSTVILFFFLLSSHGIQNIERKIRISRNVHTNKNIYKNLKKKTEEIFAQKFQGKSRPKVRENFFRKYIQDENQRRKKYTDKCFLYSRKTTKKKKKEENY